MSTKTSLQFLGTMLLLFSIFGFLFPELGSTIFTPTEIWFTLISSIVLFICATTAQNIQRWTLLISSIIFLGLGLFAIALANPTDFVIPKTRIEPHLDTSDAIIYGLIFLVCAWSWLQSRPSKHKSR